MDKPVFSIVIPSYNRTQLLREALDSVAAQTFKDYEVIVVDDGSEEDVAGAVSGHATKPRVIRQIRQGPAAARNRGVFESRADTIAFLDSDDLWMPEKLTVFLEALNRSPEHSIYYGPMLPIDDTGRPVSGRCKPRHQGAITRKLFASCFVDVPSVVCRKSVIVEAGGFDAALPVCEDYDLWLRVSLKERFGLIEQPLAKRRLHDNRLSKSKMSRNLAVKARMLQRFFEQHRESGVLELDAALSRLGRVFFQAGRAAFHEGEYQQAVELCRASRAYGRAPLRNMYFSAAAGMMAMFSSNGHQSNPDAAKV